MQELKMFRVAILLQNGISEAQNFETMEKAYDYILENDPKKFRIMDMEKSEIIETELGKR